MTDKNLRQRADAHFERALQETDARDPRDFYRAQLKELREANPQGFRQALDYYETRLIPTVASPDADPVREWLEYGRVLASLAAAGRTVQIDPTGRSRAYEPPVPADDLVLHLPDAPGRAALVVGLPRRLSPAQRATHELLVKQTQE